MKNTQKTTLAALIAIATLGAASTAAFAQQTSNTDSSASNDQAAKYAAQARDEQHLDAAFKRFDTNNDGVIDRAEFKSFLEKYTQRQRAHLDEEFAAADKNKDGRLSRAEARAANSELSKHFDDVDTNHDGFITRAEISNAMLSAQNRRLEENMK